MRDILKRFKPDRLEHLTALNALYRPGPMQMIDDFIKRRHGQTKVTYDHPSLEPILSGTYGVMVYQEQVMQIAVALAGYTLGEADILRKAMGKKKADVMAKQMSKFMDGCTARSVNEKKAKKIWDHMEQFAGYGFNKSHSAAYAWLAYQTAYLKANHPSYFMAALLTSERATTDKMVQYIGECREMGIRVLPPDVNESDMFFTVVPGEPRTTTASGAELTSAERAGGQGGAAQRPPAQDVRFGQAAIKNVGEGAVEAILRARREGGPFKSIFDFCERVDLRAVNRRVVESFVKSGCFDSIDPRRAAHFAAIDGAMEAGQKQQRDKEQGQGSLLGLLMGGADGAAAPVERLRDVPAWGEGERLAFEKESLGFFITGHPLERFRAELAQWASATVGRLADLSDKEVTVGGIITGLRLIKTKKGDRMASFVLEDLEGGAEALVFPETYKKVAGRLADDQIVLVKGKAEALDEGKARLLVAEVLPLEQAKMAEARYVTIRVAVSSWDRAKGERLRDILDAHRGECPVTLEVLGAGDYAVSVSTGASYRVRPDSTLRTEVEGLLGPGALVLARTNGAA
jgi:DNA polymerase-3 subunit alpha